MKHILYLVITATLPTSLTNVVAEEVKPITVENNLTEEEIIHQTVLTIRQFNNTQDYTILKNGWDTYKNKTLDNEALIEPWCLFIQHQPSDFIELWELSDKSQEELRIILSICVYAIEENYLPENQKVAKLFVKECKKLQNLQKDYENKTKP